MQEGCFSTQWKVETSAASYELMGLEKCVGQTKKKTYGHLSLKIQNIEFNITVPPGKMYVKI